MRKTVINHYKKNNKNNVLPKDLKPDRLFEYLTEKWKDLDENLPYSVVIEITGYSDSNVTRIATTKKVEAFYAPGVKKATEKTISNVAFINKESLIDYICGDGYSSNQKSQKHNELLKKFFEK